MRVFVKPVEIVGEKSPSTLFRYNYRHTEEKRV